MSYKQLIERMLDSYADMIGEVAYTQAGQIDEIELDEDNNIKSEVSAGTVEVVLDKFKGVMGQGAYGVARQTVKDMYEEDEGIADLEIPQEIKPKEVKAESFASAL